MFEILEKRQYTSRTFDNEDGTLIAKVSTGHLNYKGTDNSWRKTNFDFEDMGEYWQMVKASYKIMIAKDFLAPNLIRFQNKYRGANHQINYEPKSLSWVNQRDLSDMKVFRKQQKVTGVIDNKERTVFYKNAFGSGIHFKITLSSVGFRKDIIIDSKKNLELPPTKDHELAALFKYTGEGIKVESMVTRRIWSTDILEGEDGFRLHEDSGVPQSFIRPAFIADSEKNSRRIKVFWVIYNNERYQCKVLSKKFLNNAEYPIMADTVTEIDDSVGGYVNRINREESWSTIRDTTSAIGAGTSAMYVRLTSSHTSATWRNFDRAAFVVDLSAITGTITSARALMYCWAMGVSAVLGELGISLTGGSLISESNVQLGDYDGWDNNEYTVRENIGDQAVDSYSDLIFNSAGLSYLNTKVGAGNAVLFARTGNDIDNNQPPIPNDGVKENTYAYFRSAATAGYEPSLEVTYSTAPAPSSFLSQIIMS